jgi:hypothetical protein
MAILDLTAVGPVLKTQYTQNKVNNICYAESPTFAKINKKRNFVGDSKVVAFRYGNIQGRGGVLANAIANQSPTTYARCVVTRARDYAVATVAGEAVDAASNDAGALLNVLKTEIDSGFYTEAQSIATLLWGNGGGARGQLDATTTLGGTTILLRDINQIVNFERNMVLNFGSTDGTTGAKRVGTLTVTAVDRTLGTLTTNVAINSGITSPTVNDFIFQNGDFESAKSMPIGIPGWVPKVAPTGGDNFFGLDRSVDSRLSGVRYTAGSGGPIEETFIKAAALLVREGGKPDMVAMNPLDYANLVTALGSKVIYDRLGSDKDPAFGFETVKLMGPAGPISIVPEMKIGTGDAWMLTSKVWNFETLLDGPRILDLDNLKMLRNPTTDDYTFRIGYYGNFTCEAPGWNAYIKL